MFLSVLTLILTFASTIAAFGGQTWLEAGPFLKRITARGWASIAFLSLALLAGIDKELQQAASDKEQRNTIDDLNVELRQANSQLSQARSDLSKLGAESEVQAERLSGTRTDLDATRKTLSLSQAALAQQNEANFISLVSPDSQFTQVVADIEFRHSFNSSVPLIRLLWPSVPRDLEDWVTLVFSIYTQAEGKTNLIIDPGESADTITATLDERLKQLTPASVGSENPVLAAGDKLAQETPIRVLLSGEDSRKLLISRMIPKEPRVSPFQVYQDLKAKDHVANISMILYKKFATDDERNAYLRRHDLVRYVPYLEERSITLLRKKDLCESLRRDLARNARISIRFEFWAHAYYSLTPPVTAVTPPSELDNCVSFVPVGEPTLSAHDSTLHSREPM